MDVSLVTKLLEAQRHEGWHDGAQVYVSVAGETVLDTAIGEATAGRPLRADDLMLWYSAGKPLTTVSILRLWEQGRLGLDDRIADYLDGWGGGKQAATIRQVLTHTGGFPMYGERRLFDAAMSFDEMLAIVAAAPAEWEPGTDAGYHLVSGWIALGGIVQAVDGRPINEFVRDEILLPVGASNCWMGIPIDEQVTLGDRIAPIWWKGHVLPVVRDGALELQPYRVDEIHNAPEIVAMTSPGGGMRGPARELAKVYESLLGFGPPLLERRTVELMSAIHRYGMRDRTLRVYIPWGLGVQVDFSGGAGRRAFGHSGMASSRGLADPERELVMVVVTNGLPGFAEAETRMIDLTDAVYSALGTEAQTTRRAVRRVESGPSALST